MKLLLIVSLVTLLGCQKSASDRVVIWSKGTLPPPSLLKSRQFSQSARSVLVMGDVVKFREQKWGPARIEGGSLHLIENARGETLFARADFSIDPEGPIGLPVSELDQLNRNKNLFFESIKSKFSFLVGVQILSGPELVINFSNGHPRPLYAVDLKNPTKQFVQRYWFSPSGEMIRSAQVSQDFDLEAWVFTPQNLGEIQSVLLKNLLESKDLRALTHHVSSQAIGEVTKDGPLQFAPDDPRFDQAQAFFYVQKGIEFFNRELGFTLPVAVEVETAVGYPQNTNAAFTYKNQIRLGTGDGQSYHRIAQDPSVVLHEVGHIINDTIAHLATQGEAGSLNEGFADYFAAAQTGSPKMGSFSFLKGPYKRNLVDVIRYTEKNGGLYHDSQIVSGTLWELHHRLGNQMGLTLAMKTLSRLGPARNLSDFSRSLRLAARESLNTDQMTILEEILVGRQWPE